MIVALHGFLGLPSDWDFLREAGFDVLAPPLDAIPEEGDILLGYSMGGRLALHALLGGARYRQAVIISAGLGIEDKAERAARRIADDGWARRFLCDDWAVVMREWDAQPLFGGHRLTRAEEAFDRRVLAQMLRRWSPGQLPPLLPRLVEIQIPVLWMAGEMDQKYAQEGRRAVALLPKGRLWVCPGAAHRLPWEKPALFIEQLRSL